MEDNVSERERALEEALARPDHPDSAEYWRALAMHCLRNPFCEGECCGGPPCKTN